MVAGIVTPLLVELMELALSIDDPSGAITVHAVGGLWGLLAAGVFLRRPASSSHSWWASPPWLAWSSHCSISSSPLNRFVPFRVDPDGERIGMDLHELGGGAYPEFVIHRDESYR